MLTIGTGAASRAMNAPPAIGRLRCSTPDCRASRRTSQGSPGASGVRLSLPVTGLRYTSTPATVSRRGWVGSCCVVATATRHPRAAMPSATRRAVSVRPLTYGVKYVSATVRS
jgi:hypothetical protein